MTDCKELLVALAQSVDDPRIGILNLYSEKDCGNSIGEQVRQFFGEVAGIINNLTPGQYLYSYYKLEYHGKSWSFDAKLVNAIDDFYLYKIGNDAE